MRFAAHDIAIAVFDAKYAYWGIRPSQTEILCCPQYGDFELIFPKAIAREIAKQYTRKSNSIKGILSFKGIIDKNSW